MFTSFPINSEFFFFFFLTRVAREFEREDRIQDAWMREDNISSTDHSIPLTYQRNNNLFQFDRPIVFLVSI